MLRSIAAVALIAFSLVLAIAGGVRFGQAVSTPAELALMRPIDDPGPAPRVVRQGEKNPWPGADHASDALRIAKSRAGIVSFAAIGPDGVKLGFKSDRHFFSASVSKAMLLVAELRKLRREEAPLDERTRDLLERMITVSDNDAADAIYELVGDPGLNEVAEISGMTGFDGDVGHWSNVKLTSSDLALFMSRLDELLDLPGGKTGSAMLAGIAPEQSWGIPQVAPDAATIRFKGGWRPTQKGQLVHQMARVDLNGESYSLAILTTGNPSMAYGEETIRLIAAELLR